MNLIVATHEELRILIREAVREELVASHAIYSRNQVAQILKMSNSKLQRLIDVGKINTTNDGKITHKGLNDYLNGVKL